jgi:hypothetical protein
MCPTLHKVDGDPCYPSLSALPERVDVAIVMLPAEECAAVAEEMARLGIRRAWLAVPQPAWLRTVTPMFRERGIASTFGCPLMHWNLADVSPANRLRHFCWLHGLRSRKIHHQDRGG